MNDDDPYRSPQAESSESSGRVPRYPRIPDSGEGISTANTIVPRYVAAILDDTLAIILSIIAAKSVSEEVPILQLLALVGTYLGYYFLWEGFTSRTPGKFVTGLIVVQADGRPCSWRQVFIRTAFRVLEVNPFLLGGLPAALGVVFSRRHQRFGDRVANTIVVPPERLAHVRTPDVEHPTASDQ